MSVLNGYAAQILGLLLLALFGFLGVQAKNLFRKYANTEVKQAVVRNTVRYIEQIYVDLHGPEKLHKAMEKASALLEGYGITITEEELIVMIEAAVNEFNNAFGWVESGKHLNTARKTGSFPTVDEVLDNTGG